MTIPAQPSTNNTTSTDFGTATLVGGMVGASAGQTIGMIVVGPSVVQTAVSSGLVLTQTALMTNIALAAAPIIIPTAIVGGGIGATIWTVNKVWNWMNS